MDNWWDVFTWFGIGIAALLAFAALAAVVFILVMLCIMHFPKAHLGRPKNQMTWQTHDGREIVTTKDGWARELSGKGQLIQHLRIKWWVGFSSRGSAKWFFGLLRTENHY
jgi:beta-lactamase class D